MSGELTYDYNTDERLFRPDQDNFRKNNRVADITDGTAYRKSHKDNAARLDLQPEDNLVSLIVNTDGLQINRSGRQSAWPVFAIIAEIKPHRRAMTDKILNLALWNGEGKPPIEFIL